MTSWLISSKTLTDNNITYSFQSFLLRASPSSTPPPPPTPPIPTQHTHVSPERKIRKEKKRKEKKRKEKKSEGKNIWFYCRRNFITSTGEDECCSSSLYISRAFLYLHFFFFSLVSFIFITYLYNIFLLLLDLHYL